MQLKHELERIINLEAGARALPAGAHLYLQGDRCSTAFIVLNGWIALSVLLHDGSCQIVDFALAGAMLGFPNADARCITPPAAFPWRASTPFHNRSWISSSRPTRTLRLCF